MSRVIVYSTDNCPFCLAAIELLNKEQIDYQQIKLDGSPESRSRVFEETGGMSFPQIVIDGEPIGGYDQLLARQQSGQILPSL